MMVDKKDNSLVSREENNEKKTVEIKILDYFLMNFISFIVPLYPCLCIFLIFEYRFILFFNIPLLIHLLLVFPLFIFLYYLYLILLIEFVTFWVNRINKKSPPIQGIFERILDDEQREETRILKAYHKRGFLIKFPVWSTSKSPFPWLLNRALRKIGHNIIGKNVIYCDGFAGLEFTEIENDTFIYPTGAISSHAVNSVFGKISILKVKIGEKTTIYPGVIVGPGALTEKNFVIYPNTVLHKGWRGKEGEFFYQGSPGRPIKSEKGRE